MAALYQHTSYSELRGYKCAMLGFYVLSYPRELLTYLAVPIPHPVFICGCKVLENNSCVSSATSIVV